MAKGPKPRPVVERLLARRRVEPESGCWVWQGYCINSGYGQIYADGRMRTTHRVSYELFVGPIPEGASVCHRCDNPPCFNPEHLFLGDYRINGQDMAAKDRGRGVRFANARQPARRARGAGHGNAKLTETDVLAIRADTRSLSQIAAAFGISDSAVCHIRARRNWAHL